MDLKHNDRVEYAAKTAIFDYESKTKTVARRQFVGYVKRVYRKWFTTYVEICECRTRRIDTVNIKDVFSKVDRKPNNHIKSENHAI